MFKRTSAGLAAGLLLTAMSAQAAVVNGVFTVSTGGIQNLYSATLDGACTPGTGFFSCDPDSPTGNAVVVTNLGTGSGTLDVQYDDVTGQITQVNSMAFVLPDMDITISGALTGDIEIRQGNGAPVANDEAYVNAGVTAANGTADADQNAGSINLFQHDDSPNEDAPDFATFSDIVDSCVGSACGLIAVLGLDGVKYQLDGTISATGGDTLGLIVETGNKSSYTLDLTTAVVPVPAAVWLFGSALGLLGWMRKRAA